MRQTSHIFHTDLQKRRRQREREDPLSQEKLSKNIRSHCPIFYFTPKLRGSGCSRSKPFPLHGTDHAENPSGGGGSEFRSAYLFHDRPQSSFRSFAPTHSPCIHTLDKRRSHVGDDSCAHHVARHTVLLVLECAGTHCSWS